MVFSKELSGWYVLPGVSRAFPVEVSQEESKGAKRMKVQGTAGDEVVKGQFDVDAASLAQLAATSTRGKLDVQKLAPPAQQ
jgi:hypothetical protein